jgi:pimeloyl-ACP methyl ester carboxylesterase
VVENRTGAAGHLAAEALARAQPDGYTLGTVGMPTALISPMLYRKLPYDPSKDYAWIGQMWEFPNVVVVPASLPVRTLAEFIAWGREDRILPFSTHEIFAREIAGAQFLALPACGHAIPHERGAEVARAMGAFMNGAH